MLRIVLIALAAVVATPAVAADPSIDTTRTSAFNWQCQNADGSKVSNHNSDLEAFTACANLSFKDGKARLVQGGQWRILAQKPASTPIPPGTPPPVPPTPALGTANLGWSAPTQNTDGSALTDLAGYRVYHGRSPTLLPDIVQLPSVTTSYAYGLLTSGTHYFAVAAYNSSGVESVLSGVGSKSVP